MSETTAFDSGVYDPSKLTTPFTAGGNISVLSAANNALVINTLGTQNGGTQIVGVLHDNISSQVLGPLSSVTLTSPDGGTNTTIRSRLSAGITIVLIDVNHTGVEYTLPVGGTSTLAPVASSTAYTGPNIRRLYTLGYI